MKKRILSIITALALFMPMMCAFNIVKPLSTKAESSTPVAQANGVIYYSFDRAWAEAIKNGGTFKLLTSWLASNGEFKTDNKDYKAYFKNGALCVPEGKTVTIDLNGYNISRGLYYRNHKAISDGEVIYLSKKAELNIKDTSSGGNGCIEDGNSKNGGGGIHAKSGSHIYMYGGGISYCQSAGGAIFDGHNGSAVHLESGATMYMYGGKLFENNYNPTLTYPNNRVPKGGTVKVESDSRFYMYGGEILYNHAIKYNYNEKPKSASLGTAIYSNEGGIVFLDGGSIHHNVSNFDQREIGATVYCEGELYLRGTELAYNSAYAAVQNVNRAYYRGGSIHDNEMFGIIVEPENDTYFGGNIVVKNGVRFGYYRRDKKIVRTRMIMETFDECANIFISEPVALGLHEAYLLCDTAGSGQYAKYFHSRSEHYGRVVSGNDGRLYYECGLYDEGPNALIKSIDSVKQGNSDIDYELNDQDYDWSSHNITIHVPENTDVTNLAVSFTTTGTAESVTSETSPKSGSVMDFTKPVIYTLLGSDGRTEQNWTITVVKNLKVPSYNVTVNSGTGGGNYRKGSEVSVAADEVEDKRFVSWNAEGVELTDEQKASQAMSFTMPKNDVTLTPEYRDLQSLAELTITEPSSGQGFDEYAAVTLPEGGSAEIPIEWTPKEEKAEFGKTYTAVMSVSSQFGFAKNIRATVNGNEATVSRLNDNTIAITYEFNTAKAKLQSITAPTMNADNGTKFENMQLPQKVGIMTTDANIVTADVTWETKPASYYNPLSLYAQQFTVKGTVTLPEAVEQNEVDLNVKLTVNVSAANTVESVQASLNEGSYTEVQQLVLSTPTEGAKIYYNISDDGTTPEKPDPTDSDVKEYTAPIRLGEVGEAYTYCISAIAVKDGMFDSKEAVYKYRVDVPKPKYEVKVVDKNGSTAGLGGGTYCEGDTVTVKTTAAAGDHVFKNWSVKEGSLTLTDEQKIASSFTFTMPAGNVTLQADFIDAINKIELDVNAPEAGKILDKTAGYKLYNSASEDPVLTGSSTDAKAPVIVWNPSHTTAAYNTDYMAYIKLLPNEENDIVFSDYTEIAVDEGEAIAMKNDDGSLDIYFAFDPTAKAKLNSITAPAAISVPYNTPIENITLPSIVQIDTDADYINTAGVLWDTSGYLPTSSGAQTINGTVILSDDVDENGKALTTTLTINVAEQEKAPVPMASVASGTYTENQTVTLTAEGADIYYTTDGTEPTTGSTKYTDPISVTGTEGTTVEKTIKAISVAAGKANSAVAEFNYTIALPAKTYTVNVINGTGSGEYEAGKIINIMAQPGAGMAFTNWKAESVYYTTETVKETIHDENGEQKEIDVEKRVRNAEPVADTVFGSTSRPITTLTVPALDEGRTLEVTAECLETVTAVDLKMTLLKGGESLPTGMTTATDNVSITENSFSITPNDGTAKYNTTYTMSVNITANEGYIFGENPVFSINGAAASPKKNTDGSYTVTYVYKTAKDAVTSVTNPSAVTDLPNGISMNDIIGKLPQTVAVTTEGGTITESQVSWNAAPVEGSYAPTVKTAQTFKLSGVLNLPETVTNPKELTAEIEVTVNAVKKYKVTVNGGSGSGDYEENSTVPIVLTDEYTDKVFTGWSIDKENVLINNPISKSTFFTMPSEDVVVTAIYKDKIDSVALTGEVPKAGEPLLTEVTCETEGVTASLAWTPSDTVAGYNKSYTANIKLKADSANFYEFADNVSVIINGQNADVTVNADKTITVSHEFTTDKAKLTEIIPSKLTGIKNGTALEDMPLPSKVSVVTEDSDITSADVEWDMSTAVYDSTNTGEQSFTLKGRITSDNINTSEYNGVPTLNVTVSSAGTAAAPIASPIEGTYTENQKVTLTTVTEGAEIWYSVNGGDFVQYADPIEVTGTQGETVTTVIK
ncbi:MAG: chitobiase/beta-hexosaminidase C-terminal domain-containing protein, partial [Hominilimicola sp.]